MANGHVDPSKTMTWANTGSDDVKNGDVVIVGALTGIALGKIPAGEDGELGIAEQWELPKASGSAIEQGAALYWDGAAMSATAVTGRAPCYAMLPAEADAERVCVLLNGR